MNELGSEVNEFFLDLCTGHCDIYLSSQEKREPRTYDEKSLHTNQNVWVESLRDSRLVIRGKREPEHQQSSCYIQLDNSLLFPKWRGLRFKEDILIMHWFETRKEHKWDTQPSLILNDFSFWARTPLWLVLYLVGTGLLVDFVHCILCKLLYAGPNCVFLSVRICGRSSKWTPLWLSCGFCCGPFQELAVGVLQDSFECIF